MWEVEEPPRAQPAPKDDQIRDLESRIEELRGQVASAEELRKQLEKERREQQQREEERRKAAEAAKAAAAAAAAADPKPEPEKAPENP